MKIPTLFIFLIIFILAAYSVSATTLCYQEYANETGSCADVTLQPTLTNAYISTGAFDSGYEAKYCYDGNYSRNCCDSSPASYGYVKVNYTKPNGATSYSLWQTRPPDVLANWSIPLECWNASTTNLVFYLTTSGDGASLKCWDGAGWVTIHAYNFETKCIYEEGIFWSVNTTLGGCSNTSYGSNVYKADDFNYYNYVDACGWEVGPVTQIQTTSSKLYYDATAAAEQFSFNIRRNIGYAVFSEEFDATITASAFLEKSFRYVNLDGSDRRAYTLSAFVSGGVGQIQVILPDGNTTTAYNICSGCFTPGASAHFKITMYGADATSYIMFNSTSATFQPIYPNTFMVQINSVNLSFNLPLSEVSEDGANLPDFADFYMYGGPITLDNYILYSGVVNLPQVLVNETGLPYKQLNEKCSTDSECLTRLCSSGSCSKKDFGASCVNYFECISGKCTNNLCEKPSWWQWIDFGKSITAGNDSNTNNLISLIISIVLAGLTIFAGAKLGAGSASIIAGIGVLTISLLFFTLVLWLSAFIFIVYFMALAIAGGIAYLWSSGG